VNGIELAAWLDDEELLKEDLDDNDELELNDELARLLELLDKDELEELELDTAGAIGVGDVLLLSLPPHPAKKIVINENGISKSFIRYL
jgi:hypothetical protein